MMAAFRDCRKNIVCKSILRKDGGKAINFTSVQDYFFLPGF